MTYYLIIEDGEKSYCKLPEGVDLPEGAIEVDRLPNDFEDFVDGKWVKDNKLKADIIYNEKHVNTAHIQKAIEAKLIKNGYDFKGLSLLEKEATELNLNLADLVDSVIQNNNSFEEEEIQRRILKNTEE